MRQSVLSEFSCTPIGGNLQYKSKIRLSAIGQTKSKWEAI
jgi:hypothetical protein